MADIPGEVQRLVSKRLDVAESLVELDASFIQDLGADSLAIVELTLLFEQTFDIDVPDQEARGFAPSGTRWWPSRCAFAVLLAPETTPEQRAAHVQKMAEALRADDDGDQRESR